MIDHNLKRRSDLQNIDKGEKDSLRYKTINIIDSDNSESIRKEIEKNSDIKRLRK